MNAVNRIVVGLVCGFLFGAPAAVFLYMTATALTGHIDGDFGLGFGLVIAPLIGVACGVALAVWLYLRGSLDRPGRWLLLALAAAVILIAGTFAIDDITCPPMQPCGAPPNSIERSPR